MPLTVSEFLDADADQLCHKLAGSARSTSVDGRYVVLGPTCPWHAFTADVDHTAPMIRDALKQEVITNWHAWISAADRVIYSERMLENLYSMTLITRVKIALENAFSSDDRPVTIIACPGAFDSHDPDVRGGKETVILPDWVVLEASSKPHDDKIPDLEELALSGRIVAVGDTKLVSWRSNSSGADGNAKDIIPGTHSCHRRYMAQVQHYAKMLRTRFGFVVTNDELVVAQFLREEEAAPRLCDQRGLRSSTRYALHPSLSSDFHTSGTDGLDDLGPSHITKSKRRHPSSDNSIQQRQYPAPVSSENQEIDGLPSTPLAPARVADDLPSSPPMPSQAVDESITGRLVPIPDEDAPQSLPQSHITINHSWATSGLPSSPSRSFSSESSFPLSSGEPYLSSDRDHDIGQVLFKSIIIRNSLNDDAARLNQGPSPAKALFVMLVHALSVGKDGRRIGTGETPFGG
jgi:hypothetical protein